MSEKELYRFVIRIAHQNIGMEAIYGRMLMYSREFLTDQPADFVVTSSQAEILEDGAAFRKVNPWGRVYKGEIESILLLRKIADRLIDSDIILVHGAVVAVNGEAYLFTAPSGIGKTTHIRLWLENLPEAYVVNGDKPLIMLGEKPMACGTPWCGKERMGNNAIVPLKAIVMMKRGEENVMRPLTFLEAFPRLVEQTHRTEDTEKMRKTVRLLSSLGKQVELWQFEFDNFKSDAFEVAYRALTKREKPDATSKE